MSKTQQKRTNKKEAKKLVFALHHSRVSIYGDKAREVFEKIYKEVEEIKWKRTHFLELPPKISFEAPFVQGDGVVVGLPDIMYEAEEYVIGIEHFEFDASGKNSKGSKMRRAELRAETELEAKRKGIDTYPIYLEASVNVDFSYEGYVQSLLNAFGSHSNKIIKYRTAIEKRYPGKNVFFAFFVEDNTAIGNYVSIDNAIIPIYPLHVKEFLDAIALVNGIDFLIFSIQDFYKKELHIQQIDKTTITELYDDVYDMSKVKYIPYHYKKSSHIYSATDNECEL